MKKVVILGGGFAGIETALRLKQYKDKIEIIVVNKDDCFTFIPSLYETAAGELSEGDVCVLLSKLLGDKKIHFYHDEVEGVNLEKKFVKTKKAEIDFDFLVVTVGAETNYFGIPGAEFLANLKTKDDAESIYEFIDINIGKKPLQFVVCGGGLTGVEFAGTLQDHINTVSKEKNLDKNQYKVTLVERAGSLLPGLPKKAIDYAESYLKNKGIVVNTNMPITKIERNLIYSNETVFPFDLAVWCGGLKTHSVISKSSFPLSEAAGGRGLPGGGMIVNEYLQVKDYLFVFGAGDAVCLPEQKVSVIKTAQNAVDQAKYVAYNIHALLGNKKMKKYVQKKNTFYVALGKDMGMHLNGETLKTGKAIKQKKDKLELNYVKILTKGKIPKTIYG
ncbi:hypothetical protein C4573_00625 [Candidatus Woesearchaeota archaeon]|nr:MAG: hypothetical protein C4573_00625 [Candidatus Woesearchaeota archaeon]